MIEPSNITNLLRNRPQLEELTLYATLVDGKQPRWAARTLETMLQNGRFVYGDELTPFDVVRCWIERGVLGDVLRRYETGQSDRLERCWTQLTKITPVMAGGSTRPHVARTVQVDLRDVRVLERIHGIGPKTARFIVMHSVVAARCIPIDTHWIKELQHRGYPIGVTTKDGVPVVTMTPSTYRTYESYALAEVSLSRMSAPEYDLHIWRKWNGQAMRKAA